MKGTNANDLVSKVAVARLVLSILALTSWYIDPADGGWFFIDHSSLIIFTLHLAYSVVTLGLVRGMIGTAMLPPACMVLDIVFAATITIVTEGSTSPSWLFFLFAILAVDTLTSFRSTMSVTISSALLYFALLVVFVPGPRNEYLMRSAYLAIVGYLIGFIGRQRAKFEARVRDLEAAAERREIALALHDGYIQALAGVKLQLATWRTLMEAGRSGEGEVLAQINELQDGLTREYTAVRAYIRSLADVQQPSESRDQPFPIETRFGVTANFSAPARVLEQTLLIMLEAVRNTRQHSSAPCASIRITADDELLCIAVDDDGVGFRESEHPPWTIASRVAQYGGRLRMSNEEHTGAHLEIQIPTG
jgi:signal transduction histidine kinase